jgi:hypothetical protein
MFALKRQNFAININFVSEEIKVIDLACSLFYIVNVSHEIKGITG